MLNRKGRLSLSLLQFKREIELNSIKGKKNWSGEFKELWREIVGYLQMPYWF